MDIQAPLPPPPPPSNAMFLLKQQETQNLNSNRNLSDRSQLLIDIERGATLKKVGNAQKGLNGRPLNQVKHVSVFRCFFSSFSYRLKQLCLKFSVNK